MTSIDPTVVTLETWRPGLPPPIEALQEKFPPERGYTVEYGVWIETDDEGGFRRISTATVSGHGREITFFPERPRRIPGSS